MEANSKCRGPEGGEFLAHSRIIPRASVVGIVGLEDRVKVRKITEVTVLWGCVIHCKAFRVRFKFDGGPYDRGFVQT